MGKVRTKGVLTWRSASPLGRASPLCRDPTCQLNSLSKFVFVYMRGGPAKASPPWRDLAIDYRDLAYRRAGNFHINALKRAGPPRRAITFHFTSSVCLRVGYKMKTCTQISDSGFRWKINVVSPGDSAKRASPGRRACFSHVNAR